MLGVFQDQSTPSFVRESLKNELNKFDIDYQHIVELGGFRGRYEDYVELDKIKEGINKILELAKGRVCCFMCLERKPSYCHRRFIIQELEGKGIEVLNL